MRLSNDERFLARRLRRQSTDAERRIWYHLRGHRLRGFHFRRQHPVGGYFADFACIELGLIVELDGGQHDARREHDEVRSAVLAAHGFDVLRFWNNDVLGNTSGVLATIVAKIDQIQERRTGALTRASRDLSR